MFLSKLDLQIIQTMDDSMLKSTFSPEDYDLIKAGKKDMSKLTAKVVTDKNGVSRKVYVNNHEEVKDGLHSTKIESTLDNMGDIPIGAKVTLNSYHDGVEGIVTRLGANGLLAVAGKDNKTHWVNKKEINLVVIQGSKKPAKPPATKKLIPELENFQLTPSKKPASPASYDEHIAKYGKDHASLIADMKKDGHTWKESDNKGINVMRAKMALKAHYAQAPVKASVDPVVKPTPKEDLKQPNKASRLDEYSEVYERGQELRRKRDKSKKGSKEYSKFDKEYKEVDGKADELYKQLHNNEPKVKSSKVTTEVGWKNSPEEIKAYINKAGNTLLPGNWEQSRKANGTSYESGVYEVKANGTDYFLQFSQYTKYKSVGGRLISPTSMKSVYVELICLDGNSKDLYPKRTSVTLVSSTSSSSNREKTQKAIERATKLAKDKFGIEKVSWSFGSGKS